MTNPKQMLYVLLLILVSFFAMAAFVARDLAHGRGLGQWEAIDPEIRQWYQSLMQPDVPTASCCGEADAYLCDDYYYSPSRHKSFCRVTDDRPDEPRGRPHVEVGTEIEIPPNKLKYDRGNPTGHGVVFISRGRYVFCYVQPGGA